MKWILGLLVSLGACGPSITTPGEDPNPQDLVDGAPPPDGEICAQTKVDITKQTPTVLLLVDRSYSMTSAFGNTTRWNAIYSTLMDPATGVVAGLQGSVRFGLDMFTSGSTCPYMVYVPPALDDYNAINTVYQPATPLQNTPTGPAIASAVASLAAVSAPGPKFIVLATDGLPNDCTASSDGRAAAIAAAQNAYAQGIKLFVVGVSADISGTHLQDMANAGSGLTVGGTRNATYWQAYDPSGVVSAMQQIIGGVRSCNFTLSGQITPRSAGQGTVVLDGRTLTYSTDWTVAPDGKTLELLGSACDALKGGSAHDLAAEFPCPISLP